MIGWQDVMTSCHKYSYCLNFMLNIQLYTVLFRKLDSNNRSWSLANTLNKNCQVLRNKFALSSKYVNAHACS